MKIKFIMKVNSFLFLFFLICLHSFSQNFEKAMEYFNSGKYDQAAIEFETNLSLIEDAGGISDTNVYAKILLITAVSFDRNKDYQIAESYYLKAISIYSGTGVEFNLDYATALHNLARLYFDRNNYESAEPLYKHALEIRKKSTGNRRIDYAISLNDLAILYKTIGDLKNAETFFKQALVINKEVLGKSHPYYVNTIKSLAGLYKIMNNYPEAEIFLKEFTSIMKDSLGVFNSKFAKALNSIAVEYQKIGNYTEAINLSKQASEIFNKVGGDFDSLFATSLNNLARLYMLSGNYQVAELYYKQAAEIYKINFGENSVNYALVLDNLSELYRFMGNYPAAEPICIKALEIRGKVLGQNHPHYAISLNHLAGLYFILNNYAAAEPLFKQALDINKNVFGESDPNYAMSLNNLGLLYYSIGNYSEAEIYYIKALAINEKTFGESNQECATNRDNLASLYIDMGEFDKAELNLKTALKITKINFGENHSNYAHSLGNLGFLYSVMGSYKKAEPLYKESLEIFKKSLGESHPSYTTSLNNLASLYYTTGNFRAAEPLFLEANRHLNKKLQDYLFFLAENEKEDYLKPIDIDYQIYHSFLFNVHDYFPSYCSSGYNNELLRKEMILTSGITLRKSIEASKDTLLVFKYEKLRNLKRRIDSWSQTSDKGQSQDRLILEKEANALEKDLLNSSRIFPDMKKQFSLTWEYVQKELQPDQAVIEFINFRYKNGKGWTDSNLYCALVIRNRYENPKLIYLCEERELEPLLTIPSSTEDEINSTYSLQADGNRANDLYKMIWNPLETYLKDVKRIDFAVTGQLNRVAFHALTDATGNLLLNKYDLVQLSSTREVALPKKDKHLESIAVFGGIDYNSDTSEMLALAREVTTANLPRSVYRSDTTNRNLSLNYLPGTMEEAKEVGNECRESGIEVNLFLGRQATEEQFRFLGEKKSPTIIHIATHGFYFPEEKQKGKEERMRFMQIGQENQFVYSPDPLIRSGLAMAGANHAWQGEKIPEGAEDGILTARDVSQMNFLNTELVVLSACQTGLGDVKGSEGVYGLQRAFKMAGARQLLMSLWKVPDGATKEFMIAFYGHLSSKMSIRESYRKTQKEMNVKYPDDPFKWAAFVLVE